MCDAKMLEEQKTLCTHITHNRLVRIPCFNFRLRTSETEIQTITCGSKIFMKRGPVYWGPECKRVLQHKRMSHFCSGWGGEQVFVFRGGPKTFGPAWIRCWCLAMFTEVFLHLETSCHNVRCGISFLSFNTLLAERVGAAAAVVGRGAQV